MPPKPSWAIVCGLIRDEANALRQARELARMQKDGLIEGVVFATWLGEFAKYPDVVRAFRDIGAKLVESQEPSVKIVGHALHQAKSLLLALSACPDGRMVLKIRPDIVPISDIMLSIISGERMQAQMERASPTLFRKPVFVHSGFVFWPFYLNDIYYFGLKEDLQKIANVDLKAEMLYNELAPEQFFHLAPVLDTCAAIRGYMRLQRGVQVGDQRANDRYQRILLSSPFWPRVWGAYMRLLCDNYYVGYWPDEYVSSEENLATFGKFRIRDILRRADEMPQLEFARGPGAPIFHSVAWALAGVRGAYRSCRVSEAVREAASNAYLSAHETPILPDPDAQRLAEKLKRTFANYAARIAQEDSVGIHRIGGGAERITLIAGGDEARDLHSEINVLRRRVDDLTGALARRGN